MNTFTHVTAPAALVLMSLAGTVQAQYTQSNIVSSQAGEATYTDSNLVNPGNFASGPMGPMYFASTGAGVGSVYDGTGFSPSMPVNIPAGNGMGTGSPTGVVYNPGADFTFMNGTSTGPAQYIFASNDGSLSAFSSDVGPDAPDNLDAVTVLDASMMGANFTGLSYATTPSGDARLLAPDFRNGSIMTFDNQFQPITPPGAFNDPSQPSNLNPYNTYASGDDIFVSYADPDDSGDGPEFGAGAGAISVYDAEGNLQRTLATGGELNAPAGKAIAPDDFGQYSNMLLVANEGDGRIHAYDPDSGAFLGSLNDGTGQPIEIEGIRGLGFGNGSSLQPENTLYFTAGDSSGGMVGTIVIPTPGTAALLALCGGLVFTRRR